jgi:HD-GYP domain-containing protein (c-di-GMP phosphodiesterase class II)
MEENVLNKYLTISVDDLKVGYYVVGIDKNWLETPFLSHRFLIRSDGEIERMKSHGIRMVMIDPNRSEGDLSRLQVGEEAPTSTTVPSEDVRKIMEDVPLSPARVTELMTQLHEYLVRRYKALFEDIRKKRGDSSFSVDTGPFVRAIGDLEKLGRHFPDALLFLAHLQSTDDDLYVHSTNVLFLSLYLANTQKLSAEESILWGICGLFHDIGMLEIPLEILHKKEPLTSGERAIIQEHPLVGERLIREHFRLPEEVAHVAGQHHLRRDAGGYPPGSDFAQTGAVTRAIMTIDVFDALITDRPYREGVSPSRALKVIVDAAKDSLDPRWATQLFLGMGVYPIGTVVELSGGEIGIVTKYHSSSERQEGVASRLVQKFSVLILKNRSGFPLTKPFMKNLSWSPKEPPPVTKTHNHSDFMIDWERLQGLAPYWMG